MTVQTRIVRIDSSLVTAIMADLRATANVELCGLLLASADSATIDDHLAYDGPLKSASFRLPDDWLLGAFLRQRERQKLVVGYYHTHPPGSLLSPSRCDLDGHPPGSLVMLLGYDLQQRIQWRVWRASFAGRDWRPVEAVQVEI